MAGQQRFGVAGIDALLDRAKLHEWVEPADELSGQRGLGFADLPRAVERLAVRLDNSTASPSMIVRRPMPAPASAGITAQPIPPAPTTQTLAALSRC